MTEERLKEAIRAITEQPARGVTVPQDGESRDRTDLDALNGRSAIISIIKCRIRDKTANAPRRTEAEEQ
ncbi:MAG: hypothetical protein ABI747_02760 [Candidatus Moraniibacteriota bacterium]